MSELFLTVLNRSIAAGWLILAILVIRIAFRKVPKWLVCCLWGLVAIRLLLPFSPESIFSLLPSAKTVDPELLYTPNPTIQTGIPLLNNVINPILPAVSPVATDVSEAVSPLQTATAIAGLVWCIGVALLLSYGLVSYLLLRRKVRTAIRLEGNVWQSEAVTSPFALGVFRPRIYLPFSVSEADLPHILAHEKAHISRKDHWIKPLGFLLLSLYWFHPLLWVAFILLCRDIEYACDEKVIGKLDVPQRADYSQSLLRYSVRHSRIAACPLAFGEVSVKQRIKNVLHYKKPAFWILIAAVVISSVVAVCLLTDPIKKELADSDSTAESTDNPVQTPTDFPETVIRTDFPPTQEQIKALRNKYPEYFDLGTSKGLVVYVQWLSPNSIRCKLASGTNRILSMEELRDLPYADVEEMAQILTTYTIPTGDIFVSINEDGISSYLPGPDAETEVRERLGLCGSHGFLLASAYHDIDGDGIPETVRLSVGPTSGVYTDQIDVFKEQTLLCSVFVPSEYTKRKFFFVRDGILHLTAEQNDYCWKNAPLTCSDGILYLDGFPLISHTERH